jgi:hypothetical protein
LIALRRRPTIHLVGLLALGCAERAVPIDVHAALSDSEPLVGVEIAALPYDPQRLLDSLAAADSTPRPDFSALEAELLAFHRPPAPATDNEADRAWRATQDTVRRLADSLRRVDRRAPGYATAYGRFRQVYRRLVERAGARDASLRELTADVRTLAERAGRAADSLRAWERVAYAGFDSVAARAAAASGRAPQSSETDGEGWARFELGPGKWWLLLQLPHRDNPFLEYRWDIPATVSGFPIRIPLHSGNARLSWRH